jgi:hypothetical protein
MSVTADDLHNDIADRIAERVLDRLALALAPAPVVAQFVDAKTLAATLGVSRRYVYEHRAELGVVALGGGSKPRLRFDLEAARTAMACSGSRRSEAPIVSEDGASTTPAGRGRRRLPQGLPNGRPPGSVLAIRGGRDG